MTRSLSPHSSCPHRILICDKGNCALSLPAELLKINKIHDAWRFYPNKIVDKTRCEVRMGIFISFSTTSYSAPALKKGRESSNIMDKPPSL